MKNLREMKRNEKKFMLAVSGLPEHDAATLGRMKKLMQLDEGGQSDDSEDCEIAVLFAPGHMVQRT